MSLTGLVFKAINLLPQSKRGESVPKDHMVILNGCVVCPECEWVLEGPTSVLYRAWAAHVGTAHG